MSVQQWNGDQYPATPFAAHTICYSEECGIRKTWSRDPQCFLQSGSWRNARGSETQPDRTDQRSSGGGNCCIRDTFVDKWTFSLVEDTPGWQYWFCIQIWQQSTWHFTIFWSSTQLQLDLRTERRRLSRRRRCRRPQEVNQAWEGGWD